LPRQRVEPGRGVEHIAGRRSAGGVPLDEAQKCVLVEQNAALGCVEGHGSRAGGFADGDGGEVFVAVAGMHDVQPQGASIRRTPNPAGTQEVTGNVPGSVVEIARVTGPEIVAADEGTIGPELTQQPHVRRVVLEIAGWCNYKLKRSARRWNVVGHGIPR